ncbi:MAG: hypothetical protein ACD_30C00017G0010 [uncultured bacterium]|uniref:Methyltransferase domain-containing protein n=4 Tax=Candidatus Daviesiibacteriota TaxID=1752718 RepID=A0A0G0ESD1_9BACT|nr:MAG: hypothetical protein ACD_30C00017G0010 [uncultured bacterium]KKQ08402.1 MAG: hypothetical protein US19_C0025G0016 [Candidatus Daviesbacteria bacterium GW2011_GWB1_36_5]KKQ15581.1 MAG: hypothetical protein US28_C0014G0024 [Candidatus Daviesbacteria bacterium GW2011_GWA1_36_8]OGE17527.1 MAG: hypothetical protein A2858_01340 [Candidatus Daviesbacteria bacterium RIFCSPHIGHO2_01_FULL_36_37]OGE36621.1 MAG: hypothetical protein A3E66_03185 [Candidatus Daviesbacteria bacterium RIFCSPHIGHO2_12_F
MRKQKRVWDKEHTEKSSLPSMASEEPSRGVILFGDYLKDHKINLSGKVIDIGCGKGRNAIYLAKLGFEVYAIDYIPKALEQAEKLATRENVSDAIHYLNAAIDSKWQFEDDFFDIAVDCFSSIDIETKKGRETYRNELLRTLKPGGLALITVVSVKDEWEAKLIKNNPGIEKNSTIWPQNNKFQKDYDEKELRDFYKSFEILELKEINKKAFKLGKSYNATNFWLVLKKH